MSLLSHIKCLRARLLPVAQEDLAMILGFCSVHESRKGEESLGLTFMSTIVDVRR